ncbi:unnamed protein product [Strongylus vulgaris]|uniref:Uncharacterized protein n=1 Tax=Strongylus vulgaris TaxID=40348 RepID=A0A3P7IC19_STRVU|nr:unnamed protein product [Strongylus vulgaris]
MVYCLIVARSRISQAEEFGVCGSPHVRLGVGLAKSATVWLIQPLGGSLT